MTKTETKKIRNSSYRNQGNGKTFLITLILCVVTGCGRLDVCMRMPYLLLRCVSKSCAGKTNIYSLCYCLNGSFTGFRGGVGVGLVCVARLTVCLICDVKCERIRQFYFYGIFTRFSFHINSDLKCFLLFFYVRVRMRELKISRWKRKICERNQWNSKWEFFFSFVVNFIMEFSIKFSRQSNACDGAN